LRADADEPALLEHADRGDVARRDPRVQRSLGHLAGELLKRTCRKALAPELPSDPVADETPPPLPPPVIPFGFTTFPGEIWRTPRSWVEASYPNLIYFNKVDKGGNTIGVPPAG
jgi:hypothetical protein